MILWAIYSTYDKWYMIYDIWYMIYDIWYMIYDIWYMIYDIWYMIYDIWYKPLSYTIRTTPPYCCFYLTSDLCIFWIFGGQTFLMNNTLTYTTQKRIYGMHCCFVTHATHSVHILSHAMTVRLCSMTSHNNSQTMYNDVQLLYAW